MRHFFMTHFNGMTLQVIFDRCINIQLHLQDYNHNQ